MAYDVAPVIDYDEFSAAEEATLKTKGVHKLQASKYPPPRTEREMGAELLKLAVSALPEYCPFVCKPLSDLRPPPKAKAE